MKIGQNRRERKLNRSYPLHDYGPVPENKGRCGDSINRGKEHASLTVQIGETTVMGRI
jgi:hypothetical protein